MRTKIAYGILGIMFVLIVHFMSPISVLAAEMWNDEISQDDVAAEMWNDENSQDDVSQADVQSEKSVEETSNIGLQEKNEQSTKEKVNMSQGDAPQGDVPQGDASQGDMPQGDAPQGDMPQGDAPQGDMPQGDTPQGDIPKGTQPVENGPVENGPEVLNVQTSANNPKIDSKLQYVLKHASEDEYIVVVIDLQAVDEDAVRALLGDAAAPSEALESAKYVYAVIAEAFLNRYFSGEGRDRILSQSGYSETVVEKIGKDILSSYRTVVKYTSTITVRAKKSEILAFAADSQVDRVSLYDDSWVPESVGVLNEAKATAKVELSHYKDLSKYREAQQKEIQLLVDRGLVAIDAYEVNAYRYIPKRLLEEKLPIAYEILLDMLEKKWKECFVIEKNHQLERIPYNEIYYLKKDGKNTLIAHKKGISSVRMSISETLHAVNHSNSFLMVDKSYAVNGWHVMSLKDQQVVLRDGSILPVSGPRLKQVKTELMRYWR